MRWIEFLIGSYLSHPLNRDSIINIWKLLLIKGHGVIKRLRPPLGSRKPLKSYTLLMYHLPFLAVWFVDAPEPLIQEPE